jgi:N-methylhydantoinase A
MTGFPSVDVRSIGAGGGSIAHVDGGGLLHVGPDSAGSVPGPAAYGRGGTHATVTDAAVVLGYLDPASFLDGAMALHRAASEEAIAAQIAEPLGLGLHEAAAAVLDLAVELMVGAIEDVTTSQGIDATDAVLIGGGGAAGLTLAAIAARLACRRALLPASAAGLSAVGALVSELAGEFGAVHVSNSAEFDRTGVNATLDDLRERCATFIAGPGGGAAQARIEMFAEARYPRQVWEIEVPLRVSSFQDDRDLATLCADFHRQHEAMFAFAEQGSPIEVIGWRARAICELPRTPEAGGADSAAGRAGPARQRLIWLGDVGLTTVPVHWLAEIALGASVVGPAVVETGLTTLVVGPGHTARRIAGGGVELIRGSQL